MAPDVALIYVNPAQMMRLIHGIAYHKGKPVESSFSGKAASRTTCACSGGKKSWSGRLIPGRPCTS
ncbi:MAG: DUF169 domain-containing protein [Deltaproteobacteria bacterium]|nr:DUF169 domain-containing protein [Deltaproteobacteria bacterium]